MVRVKVTEGLLEGELVQNEYGGTFYSFKGIPYAQPPVENLRFKAPLPVKPWEGVRSAKQFGPKSFQFDWMTNTGKQGSEDSLYLNIYTPDIKPDKPIPVMFWIHGGALVSGSGEDDVYGPEFLIKQGVIVVTINYRLEVLGFLCLDTEDVPGNAGLKDQVLALRWVNNNISNFGGDPNNITIFGESAGACSVSYHLISPMTKGLFKRAIVQSGNALCNWARAYKPRERALALARQLGCYSEDDKELYEFFKKQPLEPFVNTSVPILLSEYASDEGLVNISPPDIVKTMLETARDFPEMFVPKPLVFNLTMTEQVELGKKIRQFYFNGKNNIYDDWEPLVKFYSMEMFIHGTFRFAKLCAKRNKVYMYKFSCKSERNIFSHILGITELVSKKPVTCHADDVFYLFNAKLIPNKVDSKSKTFQLMEKVIKLWTNFAKHGNPTPDESLGAKWVNYTADKQDYLEIGNQFVAGTAPEAEELKFWDGIYEEYAQKLN